MGRALGPLPTVRRWRHLSVLPVLGIWMLPVGIVLSSLDIPPWRDQLLRWLKDKERDIEPNDKA